MTSSPISLSDLRRTFADPPSEARPMMRWWWFGPDTTRADIDRDLTAMAAGGIGGVEVAFVYPLAERPRRFGSPEFLAELAYAAQRAEALGLRFDLTLGSGWSFGGPHIGPEHAARKLHWEHREIGPDAFEVPRRSSWPHDELVAAYVGQGSLQELPDSYASLPLTADRLQVPAGLGPRVLLTATSRLTGQNVKRASYGAEGPVLDHYSAAATRRHLDVVARPMVEAVGARRIGSVFCDSLEVYAADWTPGLAGAFAERRGYRPETGLWLLVTQHADAARFRADFYRTLSELYEENFLQPLADWAHERGLRVRVQSYGEPPAALSSYRHVDLVEGEQWVWTGLPMTRWASSAARHLGVDVVSSETWTWAHAPSFRATPLDLKGEAHEHALLGINQFVGHGWPCRSSESDPGVGRLFYASGAFDDRNAWWPAMPSLMRYLQRLSWVLRQGTPVRDVLLYLPTEDAYAAFGPSIDLHQVSTGLIPPELPRALRQGGYDFDLIDDYFLGELTPDASTIVVLPGEVTVPVATQERLAAIRAAGGRVIVAGSAEPLLAELGALLAPDIHLTPATPGIGAVHRRSGSVDLWFVANTGPHARTIAVATRDEHAVVERWGARSGSASACPVGERGMELTLHPYEAVVLVGHDDVAMRAEPVAVRAEPVAMRAEPVAMRAEPGAMRAEPVEAQPGAMRAEPGAMRAEPVAMRAEPVEAQPGAMRAEPGAMRAEPGAMRAEPVAMRAEPVEAQPVAMRAEPVEAQPGAASRVMLTDWRLETTDGEDLGPVTLPHRWEDDPRIGPEFSGTMSYQAAVADLPPGRVVVLDFGPGAVDDTPTATTGMEGRSYRAAVIPPVREIVEVLVDGEAVGVVWDAPWRLDLGSELRAGDMLTLRVSNTTANALAVDETVAEWAQQAERRHGRRFRMQALDRVLDGVSSGLTCVPALLVAPQV